MEGRRCADVILRRKVSWVLQSGGSSGGGGWEGERGVHRGSCKGNSSKPLTGKTRGADYLECLQPVELKAWSFRVPYHGWCGVQRALQFSYGEGGQKPGNRWH